MFQFTNPIKSFPNNWNYKITKQKLLGKGFVNIGVFRYQIEYYDKNGKLKLTQILAGKILDYEIERYKKTLQHLKKEKIITYPIRTFNLENTNIQTINFEKSELNNILFLTDFSLLNHKVEPINEYDVVNSLNKKLCTELTLSQQKIMFEQILDSWNKLINSNLYFEDFDLWLIIYNNYEIFVQLVDIDCVYHGDFSEDFLEFTPKNLNTFLRDSPNSTKQIFLQVLNNSKYSKLIKQYKLEDFKNILL